MSDDIKRTIRVKGAVKIVVGLVMLAVTALILFVGLLAKFVGGFSLIAGSITKAVSIFSEDQTKKAFWDKRTEKLIYFGTLVFLSGWILAIPFLPGVIMIFEGIYNAVAMDDSCGSVTFIQKAGKFVSELVSGSSKESAVKELTKKLEERKEEMVKNEEPKKSSALKPEKEKKEVSKKKAPKKAVTTKKKAEK